MLNDAQRQLVIDNMKLVYKMAHEKGVAHDEDALQYGFVGLCKAAESFNEKRGVQFSTFACNYIKRWLDGMYSDIKLRQRIKEGKFTYVEDVSIYQSEVEIDDKKLIIQEILSRVDECSRRIIVMLYEGYPVKHIRECLALTPQIYYKKIRNIRKEFSYEQ